MKTSCPSFSVNPMNKFPFILFLCFRQLKLRLPEVCLSYQPYRSQLDHQRQSALVFLTRLDCLLLFRKTIAHRNLLEETGCWGTCPYLAGGYRVMFLMTWLCSGYFAVVFHVYLSAWGSFQFSNQHPCKYKDLCHILFASEQLLCEDALNCYFIPKPILISTVGPAFQSPLYSA
jgi:hypothetical protein